MNWNGMNIKKKIALGFGVVLVLLTVVGILSFTGVAGIVMNAGQVIDGNKLDGNLAQKEVDHLNWVNKVNELLTDENVTSLAVQTDDHQCGFGKWLYGEGRKQAETLVPSLAPLLKEIEEPHRNLHASAIEIGNAFRQPHSDLALTLSKRLTDHVNWVGQLGKALASEAGGLYSYQAQLKNNVQQAVSLIKTIDASGAGNLAMRQSQARDIIRGLRYGSEGKDYFWVKDNQFKMVMHPINPALDGQDLSTMKDPAGKVFFKEMVDVCQEKGAGFVTYQWPLPGTDTLAPKLSYVEIYKPWGWIIGTGVYLDHTNQILLDRASDFAAQKAFSTGVQLDSTKCAFGQFLNDAKTKELAESFPELKAALNAIRKPHEHLHQTAAQIEDKVNNLEMHAAMQIYNEDTQKTLEDLTQHFNAAVHAEQLLQEGLNKANSIYAEKTTISLNNVQKLLSDIRKEAKSHIMTDAVMLDAAQGTKRNVTIVGAVAIILGLVLAFFISRGIVAVLKRISDQMDEGAAQVASASGQVSSSSQQLAEGASEQAASIEETSSSLEEMSSMTKQNADNASEADRLMKEANQVVNQANQSMEELTTSMEDISKASEETSKIIKTIDEIAFQTNLLALNAAVEAARAGEAGAGFAVVADEVRNLAMRAADAAKNTAELIEGTVKKVEDGTNLVGRTNEAFTKVAVSASKVGELVDEIASASKEQAQGIDQVNTAVNEMDGVTQQNAANAEESASASEELNAQAEHMKGIVGNLLILVGASRNGSIPGNNHGHEKVRSMMPTPEKELIPVAARHQTGKASPEKIIPLDDDDFTDF